MLRQRLLASPACPAILLAITIAGCDSLGDDFLGGLFKGPSAGARWTVGGDLPVRPDPRRTFFGMLADGGYKVEEGAHGTNMRDKAIGVIPQLASYGFGRFVTWNYMGVARSVEDASAYFGPMTDVAEAHGMKVVPGLSMHHLIDLIYGPTFESPWNLPDTPANRANHPMSPMVLGEQRFWDELVERAINVAEGARSDQVYFDGEEIFLRHMNHPFWTDAAMGRVRRMARDAVGRLQEQGVFLILRHPEARPVMPALARIATSVFAPDGPDDPLAQIEFFASAPYYRTATYVLPTPEKVMQNHLDGGFFAEQVRYGFISNHASVPPHTLGFTPANYDEYCRQHEGIAEQTWFLASPAVLVTHANSFGMLAQAALLPPVEPEPEASDGSGIADDSDPLAGDSPT